MAQEYKAVTPDGWEIQRGDTIRSHHGEEYIFDHCYGKPPPSTGRVVVRPKDEASNYTLEFYPGVFNLRVVPK